MATTTENASSKRDLTSWWKTFSKRGLGRKRKKKGLDWTGYTVHDAANILRRYFNQLPEPIIPLEFYEKFRDPLRGHQSQAVGQIEGQAPPVGDFDIEGAIRCYQQLITELPPLNRQLLLYILDLLAVFASKSDLNKMPTPNLAAIFQPGILTHPAHDMKPSEYRLSQDVLIFLIENQDHFLIGMQGTAADEKTVQEVQSGPPTPQGKSPTTSRVISGIDRSGSTASSAGAESLRKFGGVRRNVSVSSKQSKKSASVAAPSPATPLFNSPLATPTTGSAVHRSNTVPSKRSPAVISSRFNRDKSSDPHTPPSGVVPQPIFGLTPSIPDPDPTTVRPLPVETNGTAAETAPAASVVASPPSEQAPTHITLPDVASPPSSEDTTPLAPPPGASPSTGMVAATADDITPQQTTHLTPPTPVKEDATSVYHDAMSTPMETPGSSNRPFATLFGKAPPSDANKESRKPNKLKKRIPSSTASAHSSTHSLSGPSTGRDGPPSPLPPGLSYAPTDVLREQPQASTLETTPSKPGALEVKQPSMSPTASTRSRDSDKTVTAAAAVVSPGPSNLGSNAGAQKSMSSMGSSAEPQRRSFVETNPYFTAEPQGPSSAAAQEASEREPERRGPMGWIRGKLAERKEREAERRAKSPPNGKDSKVDLAGSRGSLPTNETLPVRGRSVDVPRASEQAVSDDSTTPTPGATVSGSQGA
ncbi:GTPase activating protein (GAP) for Rho1p [Coniosporium tulheliwenetii]|uniref:GTPase activating protein (GAP) for Rho1p n=1 Tax=Coniosporium tulheliwenetii TaxID=3383036 RepID=A0ACC2YQM5_9PEZI|nr:GTPase activating protein (GAP) for Rho1p [Cladosporium sp. JES 115]